VWGKRGRKREKERKILLPLKRGPGMEIRRSSTALLVGFYVGISTSAHPARRDSPE